MKSNPRRGTHTGSSTTSGTATPEYVADFRVVLSRQRAAQQRDRVRRHVGEIGEGSLLHPVVVVVVALSEED